MSDSLQPYGLWPVRLLCPCDFLGKNIGVDCHFPPPGDIPDPGIEPGPPVSPALWANSLPTEPLITPKFPDSTDHRMLISALTSLKRTKVRKC